MSVFRDKFLPARQAYAVYFPGLHRRKDRTSRFCLVPAVVEAALRRKRMEVGKNFGHAGLHIGQLQLPYTGCIQHRAAFRQDVKLAACGGMAAPGIIFAYGPGLDGLRSRQRIDQR